MWRSVYSNPSKVPFSYWCPVSQQKTFSRKDPLQVFPQHFFKHWQHFPTVLIFRGLQNTRVPNNVCMFIVYIDRGNAIYFCTSMKWYYIQTMNTLAAYFENLIWKSGWFASCTNIYALLARPVFSSTRTIQKNWPQQIVITSGSCILPYNCFTNNLTVLMWWLLFSQPVLW